MAVVGIVAEYNPFHLGHLHQFEEIRKEFGPDTKIVVLLAGNFVQRGEVALLDKYTRAQAAVDCGANLVLELPFPWCCSSAEFYARGAMSLFTELGVVDVLSFGSECGDAEALKKAAQRLSSPYFSRALLARAKDEVMQKVYRRLNDAIQKVGSERNYAFVLNTDNNSCPFVNPDLGEDATDAVLSALGVE